MTVSIQTSASDNASSIENFFELGQIETLSPFLKAASRPLGKNLDLKCSILAAVLLAVSFAFSFIENLNPLSGLLLASVYFLVGIPALIESIEELIDLEISIDILMTLAAFSSVFIGSSMEGGLLLVLFAISGSMEEAVTGKAKNACLALHKLSPTKALVVEENGRLIERSVKDIGVGSHILVRSGQIVPLDGRVVEGASSVNLSHLTGESIPVLKKIGDEVPAGARNMEGALTLFVTHISNDSTLSKIIRLVTEAEDAKPPLQRSFERLSKRYAISIILLAAFFTLAFPFFFGIPLLGVEGSLYRALAFLIAASPCALIIALPIAYLSALGSCAKKGVLLKGGATLDALWRCKTIAFDKTGTLTTGELSLKSIDSLEQSHQNKKTLALSIAYSLEKNTLHPIAKAVVAHAEKQKGIAAFPLSDFKTSAGFGLSATAAFEEKHIDVRMGSLEFVQEKMTQESFDMLKEKLAETKSEKELLAFLLFEDAVFIFRFEDTLRPAIKKTVEELQSKKKLRLVMLTGDSEENAKQVAEDLGFKEYRGALKPEDKLSIIGELSKQADLCMIGDGINDAPALARANVGICMGKLGSTPAIDAADIILLQDNIESIGWLIDKADKTSRIVRQNLLLALLAIIAASIPALGGIIPLWLAVVLHEGGTVLVGINGLRLLSK